MISVYDRIENIVGKGENAGYQHFLLVPQSFQKAFFLWIVKSRNCVVKSKRFAAKWMESMFLGIQLYFSFPLNMLWQK